MNLDALRLERAGPNEPIGLRADLVKAGYRPETAWLPHAPDHPAAASSIGAMCLRLQAAMLDRASGRRRESRRFDGTRGGAGPR